DPKPEDPKPEDPNPEEPTSETSKAKGGYAITEKMTSFDRNKAKENQIVANGRLPQTGAVTGISAGAIAVSLFVGVGSLVFDRKKKK
ncbi:LPXTG cell wall anchor domain-containing protein, partial [Aerococcus sp. HMSC035B07]|uniref:LPXTG cell wall anchor domain-containing protein n=4 Tax=unclassified Aerococcus TaxID=2618060 RepID=UPI0011789082